MRNWVLSLFILLIIAGCGKNAVVFPSPGKPVLLSPAANLPCTTGTVVSDSVSSIPFIWQHVANTDSYELDVQNLFTDSIIRQTTTDTTVSIRLLRNAPYAWWVKAQNKHTPIATPSNIWKFYSSGLGAISYAPFPAEIDAPLFGAIVNAPTVKLEWKGTSVDNDIKYFTVYFGTTNNPPLLQQGVTNAYLIGISVKANTTYYWHVVTYDANGDFTDSGMFQFSVTN